MCAWLVSDLPRATLEPRCCGPCVVSQAREFQPGPWERTLQVGNMRNQSVSNAETEDETDNRDIQKHEDTDVHFDVRCNPVDRNKARFTESQSDRQAEAIRYQCTYTHRGGVWRFCTTHSFSKDALRRGTANASTLPTVSCRRGRIAALSPNLFPGLLTLSFGVGVFGKSREAAVFVGAFGLTSRGWSSFARLTSSSSPDRCCALHGKIWKGPSRHKLRSPC